MLEGERTEMVAKEDERTLRKKAIAEEARLKLQKEMLFGEGKSIPFLSSISTYCQHKNARIY